MTILDRFNVHNITFRFLRTIFLLLTKLYMKFHQHTWDDLKKIHLFLLAMGKSHLNII